MNSAVVDLVGQTIAGRYRVLRLVGEGGVGRVYEAEQVLGSAPRSVAIKLLRPEWSSDAAVKARFHREAALVAKLQHVNTVRIYDFGTTEDGTLFIAMEYLRGRSLQRLLDERGALPPERAERIVSQVAASLQEAHDLGIIHRDLKPDNILILDGHGSEHDLVKLLDFGIAKGQASSGSALTKLTALGTFVGTPAYMSPEQFGGAVLGPQSDIYSLGVTSHQILSGQLPFHAETAVQWAQAHLGTPPRLLPAEQGAGPIPDSMRQAVSRALAKEPAERQASALQFAREFSGADRAPDAAVRAAPRAVPAGAAAVGAVAAGGPRTAPMTQVPEFEQRLARTVAATLPVATLPPPQLGSARAPGRRLGFRLLLGAAGLLGLGFFALLGQRLGLWPEAQDGPGSLSGLQGDGDPQAAPPVVIAPEPAPAAPPPRAAPNERPAPDRGSAPAKPAPARPATPAPPPASKDTPAAPPAVPSPLPTPAPPPGVPALPPTVPQLPPTLPDLPLPPFNLPSAAGACERCLRTLSAGGNGSVVSASADDLLCNDPQGRQSCESQIRELAPTVAEQAARANDCPAALATEAAGLRLGVGQERFAAVHALCVR